MCLNAAEGSNIIWILDFSIRQKCGLNATLISHSFFVNNFFLCVKCSLTVDRLSLITFLMQLILFDWQRHNHCSSKNWIVCIALLSFSLSFVLLWIAFIRIFAPILITKSILQYFPKAISRNGIRKEEENPCGHVQIYNWSVSEVCMYEKNGWKAQS